MNARVFFRALVVLVAAILLFHNAQAQPGSIDSLTNELSKKQNDTTRALLLAGLGRAYLYPKTDTAVVLASEGLQLSRKIGYKRGQVSNLVVLAATNMIVWNHSKSLELLLEALYIAEEEDDVELLLKVYGSLGVVYGQQGDTEKSLEYLKKSLAISRQLRNEDDVISNSINIGGLYESIGQFDSARVYINEANELALKYNDHEFLAAITGILGRLYFSNGQPLIALGYFKSCLDHSTSASLYEGVSEAALGLARIYKQNDQTDSALYYARIAYQMATQYNLPPKVLSSSEFMLEHFKGLGNTDSAYRYMAAIVAAKDSMYNQDKLRLAQTLTLNETLRQQELAAEQAAEELERKHTIQYAFLGFGIVTFLVVLILLANSVIVNERWIHFLGVMGLLLFFEFLNLLLHPYLASITHHSPFYMLLLMVLIAAVLIPLHHRIEKWAVPKMIDKNKAIRLRTAKKILSDLEGAEQKHTDM